MNLSSTTGSNKAWFEIKSAWQEISLSHSLQIITGSNDETKRLQLEKITQILQSQFSLLRTEEGLAISGKRLAELLQSQTVLNTKKLSRLQKLIEQDSHTSSILIPNKKTILELVKEIRQQYSKIVFHKKGAEIQLKSTELDVLKNNFGLMVRHYYTDFIVSDPWIG